MRFLGSLKERFFNKNLGESQRYTTKQTFEDKFMKKRSDGFTMVEQLLTVVLIGVVAAFTIPSLIRNTQDAQYKAGAKKAFSDCSQVITRMKAENGGDLDSYFKQTTFIYDMVKYYTCAKNIGGTVLSTGTSDIYKTLSGNKANTQLMDDGQFMTSDGMFIGLENWNFMGICVDVNGYKKGPNTFGRDVFMFQIINNTLVPAGAPGTYTWLQGCTRTGGDAFNGLGCTVKAVQGLDY